MTMTAGLTLYGAQDMMRLLEKMSLDTRGEFLLEVATAAGKPILETAKENAPVRDGDLRNSLCIGGVIPPEEPTSGTDIQQPDVSDTEVSIYIGSNAPHARRRELGFIGVDSLGRRYNDPGKPYLRPAFDTNQIAAMIAGARYVGAFISEWNSFIRASAR